MEEGGQALSSHLWLRHIQTHTGYTLVQGIVKCRLPGESVTMLGPGRTIPMLTQLWERLAGEAEPQITHV